MISDLALLLVILSRAGKHGSERVKPAGRASAFCCKQSTCPNVFQNNDHAPWVCRCSSKRELKLAVCCFTTLLLSGRSFLAISERLHTRYILCYASLSSKRELKPAVCCFTTLLLSGRSFLAISESLHTRYILCYASLSGRSFLTESESSNTRYVVLLRFSRWLEPLSD